MWEDFYDYGYGCPTYRSAIVNELGEVVAWVSDLTQAEQDEILEDHPEYGITCIG